MPPRSATLPIALALALCLLTVLIPASAQAAPDLTKPYFEMPFDDEYPPTTISVSQDGSVVAVGFSYSGNVSVYSVTAKTKLWTANLDSGNYFGVALSGDGSKVYAFDGDSVVYMFSVSGGKVPVWSYPLDTQAFNIVTDHTGDIALVGAYASAHKFDATGFVDNYTVTGAMNFMTVAITPDGKTLVGGCEDMLYHFTTDLGVDFWDYAPGQIGNWFQNDMGLAISDDGQTVVAMCLKMSLETTFMICKYGTGNYYYLDSGSYSMFSLSGDGNTMVLTGGDNMRLIDTLTQEVIWDKMVSHNPYRLSVSPDGSMIAASYSDDNVLRIYDRNEAHPLDIHMEGPYRTAFSLDGSTLVATGDSLAVYRVAATGDVTSDQLSDLRNQISGMQTIILVLSAVSVITLAAVVVMVMRSRRG